MKKAAEGILNAFTEVGSFMLPEPSKAVKTGSEGRRLRVSGNFSQTMTAHYYFNIDSVNQCACDLKLQS